MTNDLGLDERITKLEKNVSKLKHENKWLVKLVKLYDDYIKLSHEEANETALIAYNHGWKSTRFEQGKKMRNDINKIKHNMENDK